MRSVPQNSRTKASGSGWPASEPAASRSPAAQPSVRSCSDSTAASDSAIPDASSSSRASSTEKRRSSARSSVKLPVQTQPMQAEAERRAGHQHDAQVSRQPRQKELERRQRVVRVQLVQIVDDEDRGLAERPEIREQPLDQHLAAHADRQAGTGGQRTAARDAGERVAHRPPEPLPVALVALDRRPAGVLAQPRVGDPGAHQGRLPAPGRSRDQGHGAGRGKPVEEPMPEDHRFAARPAMAVGAADQGDDGRRAVGGEVGSRAAERLDVHGEREGAHAFRSSLTGDGNDDPTPR